MEEGTDGGLFVGQVLEGRNPETAPNGAMHYRENLDVGFSRCKIPQHPILELNLFIDVQQPNSKISKFSPVFLVS